MKSHKWRDKYQVPGGHIELGEHMEDALHREIKEETNLDIYDIHFLVFQEFIYDETFWKPGHYIFFDFACKTESTHVILNHEAQSYIWIKPEKALAMDIDYYTRTAIQTYLQKQTTKD